METNETRPFIRFALKLLSTRDHFSTEIKLKLKQKGASEVQIEEVVKYLNNYKYLNDKKTLSSFALEIASKKRGINYLKKKLYEKGCIDLLNSCDLKTVFTSEMELDSARIFISKSNLKERIEIEKKLINRGFSTEAVREIIKELKKGEILEN